MNLNLKDKVLIFANFLVKLAKNGENMQTRLDKFGRVLIPKSVRNNLGLKPGDTLQLEEENEKLVIRPEQSEKLLVLEDGVLVFMGHANADLVEAARKDRDSRIHKLSLDS